ncbi:thermonuclease family protein [Sinorhizobium terangae]|uniref:Thermonuclease family protein n=1 Tax=Sinorhizobium terangae TaxID=110322 RepID=A0A6N7LDZ4_SINTE|nr:thermonuclease family protein [Sinorhizobium terangae]MBB4183848.1 endonuclease YncB(thermonuclease family) [Sinorhizobium terangae]MQX15125.1 thermonuclease family protein [Sinorhizobium terangae]WFU47988.1 thermonuclease family protein [Sinorhizobium terangae]
MRQQSFTIAGGFFALLLYAGILWGGVAVIRDQEGAGPDFPLETPDAAAVESPNPPAEVPAAPPPQTISKSQAVHEQKAGAGKVDRLPARTIEPQLFAVPQDGIAQPLERIAPRPPLSEPKEKPAATTIVYQRPVALAAGLIRSGETTVQLKDIGPENAEKTCERNGRSWPCGMVARTAFRNFLRARALVCDQPEESSKKTVTTACKVGNENPAEWLVSNGWATPLPGSPLEAKAEAARSAKLGFYGDDPRDLSRAPLVIDEPPVATVPDDAAPDL